MTWLTLPAPVSFQARALTVQCVGRPILGIVCRHFLIFGVRETSCSRIEGDSPFCAVKRVHSILNMVAKLRKALVVDILARDGLFGWIPGLLSAEEKF